MDNTYDWSFLKNGSKWTHLILHLNILKPDLFPDLLKLAHRFRAIFLWMILFRVAVKWGEIIHLSCQHLSYCSMSQAVNLVHDLEFQLWPECSVGFVSFLTSGKEKELAIEHGWTWLIDDLPIKFQDVQLLCQELPEAILSRFYMLFPIILWLVVELPLKFWVTEMIWPNKVEDILETARNQLILTWYIRMIRPVAPL